MTIVWGSILLRGSAMLSNASNRVIILVIDAIGTAVLEFFAHKTLRVSKSTRIPVVGSLLFGNALIVPVTAPR